MKDGARSPSTSSKHYIPEPTAEELAQLEEEIAEQLKDYTGDEQFSLAELEKITKEKSNRLLYLEQVGLLNPSIEMKGTRPVRRYSIEEVARAMLVVRLRGHGATPARIRAMLQVRGPWRGSDSARGTGAPSIKVTPGAEHLERAKVQVQARLLQTVLEGLCGAKPVPGALILVEREIVEEQCDAPLLHILADAPACFEMSTRTKDEVGVALRLSESSWWGMTTSEGEVFVRFSDIQAFTKRLETLDFYFAEISCGFRLTIGIDQKNVDARTSWLHSRFKEGRVELSREHLEVIQTCLQLLPQVTGFEIIEHPKRQNQGHTRQKSMLSVLAEMVVALRPGKWDYCGILVPDKQTGRLEVREWSTGFPQDLQRRGLFEKSSLPGWVYSFQEPLIVNDVIEGEDPRLVYQDLERPVAVAAVPAAAYHGAPIRGVMYVGTRRRQEAVKPFSDVDEVVLSILGRIAGEMLVRAEVTNKTIASALHVSPSLWRRALMHTELQLRLTELIRRLSGEETREWRGDQSVLLIAIRVGAYAKLRRQNAQLAEWTISQTILMTRRIIQERIDHDPHIVRFVAQLGGERADSLVALVAPVEQKAKQLRVDLVQDLVDASYLGMKDQSDPLVWSLPFTVRELCHMVTVMGIESTVEDLLDRVRGALKVLPNIRQGDIFLGNREFAKAYGQYEMAHHHDPDNPYHLRHLAECLVGLGQFDQAIAVLMKAAGKEVSYPGTYRRLAEAYAGKGDFNAAIMNLQQAQDLDPEDPLLYQRLAEVYVLRGEAGDINRAIDMFKEAMMHDDPDTRVQSRYMVLMARAYAQVDDYEQAISRYDQALAHDPNNGLIQYDLSLARKKHDLCLATGPQK